MTIKFKFNHDLLLEKEDLKSAYDAFPIIFRALNHEALRKLFDDKNTVADAMKKHSRRSGFWAVALIAVALMAASSAHFITMPCLARIVAGLSAICGLAGTAVGAFGVLSRHRKKNWLWHRFQTERLRQLFFQTQVALLPLIVEADKSKDWSAYDQERNAAFTILKMQFENELKEKYAEALGKKGASEEAPNKWLIAPRPTGKLPTESAALDQLFLAYRALRLNGQMGYCQNRLRPTAAFWSNIPVDQRRTLRWAGSIAIGVSVALHLALSMIVFLGGPELGIAVVDMAAIWSAIAALAVRALDEGIRPGEDVVRYTAYRDTTTQLLIRFDRAASPEEKRAIMIEMEDSSYDEMLQFLTMNEDASYAM